MCVNLCSGAICMIITYNGQKVTIKHEKICRKNSNMIALVQVSLLYAQKHTFFFSENILGTARVAV